MHKDKARRPLLALVMLLLTNVVPAQTETSPTAIQPGQPIERELAGGQSHTYSIKLSAGQFLNLTVDQRGSDVVVVLIGPDGQRLQEIDSPNGKNGPEPLSHVAVASGSYQVIVRSLEKAAASGRYEARLEALRPASAAEKTQSNAKALAFLVASAKTDEERNALLDANPDQVNVELMRALYIHGRDFRNLKKFPQAASISRLQLRLAERLDDKIGIADALYNLGHALQSQRESKQALELLQRSLALREQAGETFKAGDSALLVGVVYTQLREPQKAVESYRKSIAFYEAAGSKLWLARAQNNMGQVLRGQGKYDEALDALQKSWVMFETLGDQAGLANTTLDIAQTHQMQGNNATAMEYRQKALSMAAAAGNKQMEMVVNFQIGLGYFNQGNNADALKYYERSLELGNMLEDKNQIALSLSKISITLRLLGKYPEALKAAQDSLLVSEGLSNKALRADAQMSLGLVYSSQGDRPKTMAAYQESLRLAEEAGDKPMVANAMEKIGGIYHSQGEIATALEFMGKSLKLVEELGNNRQIIFSLNAIAGVHSSQGNYGKALEFLGKSLELSQRIANKTLLGNAFSQMGAVYLNQGDYSRALDHFQRSWKMREEIGDLTGVMGSINNVGIVYSLQGNNAKALEHFQRTLELAEKLGNKSGKRTALNNISEMLLASGDYPRALDAGLKSLALSEELGAKVAFAETMNVIANIYLAQKDYPNALHMSERAIALANQTGGRKHLWLSKVTAARAYQSLNQSDKALTVLGEAIDTIESLRTDAGGVTAKTSFFATVQNAYELYINLLMQLHKQSPAKGHDALALQVSERAKARSLLESLREARADIRKGVDAELLQGEQTLQRRLNIAAERQMRLSGEKPTEDQLALAKKEVESTTGQLQDVQEQIRRRSPRYAALTQPSLLSHGEIQQLLDPETMLLEYALGENGSYLWALTPTSVSSYEMPKRSEIDTSVRQLVALLSDGQSWTTRNSISSQYEAAAKSLGASLLPSGLISDAKIKRLVIVGDGALQYLPFGSLPSPKLKAPGSNGEKAHPGDVPLIADFEIVTLPSASTLKLLRHETTNRAPSPRSVAVLADPVFEETDQRVQALARPNPAGNGSSTVSLRDASSPETSESRALLERAFRVETATNSEGTKRDVLRLNRLPFTRFEAEGILAAAPTGQSLKATDFRANRATATSPELAQYRYVHFATHGILNSEHPELSGIVLSLINEDGKPVDGFLRLHEIYNLNLPADLVVLSACQTGLGKEIRGEGLVGLTRGFMYAGAPRVVASLWKVDDAATAELMKRFYRGMLKEKLTPAAALRVAKVEMWKQKRWNAPFFWAAFELQGEWK